jgi:hypothetical protein
MQGALDNGSNGNEIVFLYRPHVLDVESNKGLSFAGRGYELNLQPYGSYNSTTAPKSPARKPCCGKPRSRITVSRSLYFIPFLRPSATLGGVFAQPNHAITGREPAAKPLPHLKRLGIPSSARRGCCSASLGSAPLRHRLQRSPKDPERTKLSGRASGLQSREAGLKLL